MRYSQLTANQKKKLCNGAGRKGWMGYLVPDLAFREAANRHDFDYWRGCHQGHRNNADDRFMRNMLNAARVKPNGENRNVLAMLFLRRMALIYYNAVTLFGGSRSLGGFYFAPKQRTIVDAIEQFGE